jgi:hypothetical protein
VLRRDRPIRLLVDKQWTEITKYESKVPIPLPTSAARQNAVLLLCANRNPGTRDRRSLCRTLGITHSKRNQRLIRILTDAAAWIAVHTDHEIEINRRGRFVILRLIKQEEEVGSTLPRGRVHNADPGRVQNADPGYRR